MLGVGDMVSDAKDYCELDVSRLEGFIRGDIFPVRKMRGDGSWRSEKYEDMLFLDEARLERMYWHTPLPREKRKTPPGRMLSRLAFDGATDIRKYVREYQASSFVGNLNSGIFIEAGRDAPDFLDYSDSIEHGVFDSFFSHGVSFEDDDPPDDRRMLASRVEGRYADISKLRMTFLYPGIDAEGHRLIGAFHGDGRFRIRSWHNGTDDVVQRSGYLYRDSYQYHGDRTDSVVGGKSDYVDESIGYEVDGSWSVSLPYAKRAWLYMDATYYDRGHSGLEAIRTVVKVKECSVAKDAQTGNSVISMGGSIDWYSVLRRISAYEGTTFAEYGQLPDTCNFTYVLTPLGFLVENEFPATPPDDE